MDPIAIVTTTPNPHPTSDWAFPVYPQSESAPASQANTVESGLDLDLYYGGVPSQKRTELGMPSDRLQQPLAHRGPASQPSASQPVVVTPLPVPQLPTTTVWGTQFARATMEDAIELVDRIVQHRTPEFLITANLNYLMLVEENPVLREVNQRSCCILADGNPIVWRSKCEADPLPCRVAGSDMIVELARLSAEKGYRIFFLGGAPGVAEAAASQLCQWFPEMQIAGTYSPPFRQLSPDEHQQMLHRIRDAKTDILLVAFGQPKGEFWIYENLEQLAVPLSIQLGASFDFLACSAKRAPALWQKLGCEWLYRAFSDPSRLFPRYGKNLLFLLGCLMADAKTLAVQCWNNFLQPHWKS